MLKKLTVIFFVVIIFVINLALIYPYLIQSTPGWVESIEVSFIVIGRWWAQNFPHIWWNPYWYAGFPMRFSYVPLVTVSTAILGTLIKNYGQGYHLVVGIGYALVPVSLFFFIRHLTKNSWAAFWAVLLFSLVPPIGNFLTYARETHLRFPGQEIPPWRMIILLIYGEGPHTIAQIFIPLAGLFYLKFLEVKRYSWMILASLSIMLMAISNPIGLWAGGMLLGSIFIIFFLYKANKKEIIFRTFLIFILSYLFAAFWYTPGFIQSDLIAEGGGLAKMLFWHFPWGISLAGLIIGVFLYLIRRFVSSPYIATLVFWFLLTFFVIVAFYKYGIEFAPQARRYVPELDMASVALLAVIASRISKTIHKKTKFADYIIPLFVILTLFFTFKTWSAAKYFTSYDDGANRGNVEKRMNQYLSGKILPLERIFLSANYSFWINMQTDTWHLRGGHWQASIHPWEPHAGYQIISDKDGEASFYWLKIFSLKWILVNNFGSSVYYRDYNYPDKFEGILTEKEETIDSAEVLYKVPLVHEMAGPVDLNKIASLKVPQNGVDKEALKLYVSWIDENSSQFNFKRLNNDRYIIEGITGKNEGIRIAMSFDKGFRAYDENAKRLEIVKDPLGFIVIRPPKPGVNKVTLVYKQTLDFYLGWFLFAGGILLAIFLKVIIKENDGKN